MSKQKIEKRMKDLESKLAEVAAYKGPVAEAAGWDAGLHEEEKKIKAAAKTAARVDKEVEAQKANIEKFKQEILVEIADTKKRLDNAKLAHAASYQ